MCLLIFNSHRPHHDVKFEKYVVTFLFENVVVAMASYIGRVQSNSILVCKPSNNKCMLKWMHNEYQRIMLCCVAPAHPPHPHMYTAVNKLKQTKLYIFPVSSGMQTHHFHGQYKITKKIFHLVQNWHCDLLNLVVCSFLVQQVGRVIKKYLNKEVLLTKSKFLGPKYPVLFVFLWQSSVSHRTSYCVSF